MKRSINGRYVTPDYLQPKEEGEIILVSTVEDALRRFTDGPLRGAVSFESVDPPIGFIEISVDMLAHAIKLSALYCSWKNMLKIKLYGARFMYIELDFGNTELSEEQIENVTAAARQAGLDTAIEDGKLLFRRRIMNDNYLMLYRPKENPLLRALAIAFSVPKRKISVVSLPIK